MTIERKNSPTFNLTFFAKKEVIAVYSPALLQATLMQVG